MNTNYMQVVEMTDEEKLKMYLKEPKEKIAKMLIECNKIIGRLQPQVIAKTADTKPTEWLIAQYELASNRYMFNEKFILDLHTSFWKRLFVKHYTRKHLKEILSSFSV